MVLQVEECCNNLLLKVHLGVHQLVFLEGYLLAGWVVCDVVRRG